MLGFKGNSAQQGTGHPKGFKGQKPPTPKVMPRGFKGRQATGRQGASNPPGTQLPNRSGTLDSINTAEAYQAAAPTQGQADQFDVPSPMRIAALRRMKSGGYRG